MIDYAIYLSAYLMISDETIFDIEWKILKELISECPSDNEQIYLQALNIIQNNEKKLALHDLYQSILVLSNKEKIEIITTVITIGMLNDDLNPIEYEFLKKSLEKIEVSLNQFSRLRKTAKEIADKYKTSNYDVTLSVRNPGRYDSALSAMVDSAGKDVTYTRNTLRLLKNQLRAYKRKFPENCNQLV